MFKFYKYVLKLTNMRSGKDNNLIYSEAYKYALKITNMISGKNSNLIYSEVILHREIVLSPKVRDDGKTTYSIHHQG